MPRKKPVHRFARAPFSQQLLAIEAAVELFFARLNTLGSARHFTAIMGQFEGSPYRADAVAQERAEQIGYVVDQTARVMPFRAVCLQQVLATRRMLRRRHIPATVYLGVLPDEAATAKPECPDPDAALAAHAWVMSGDRVINGRTPNLDSYVVLGMFS